MRLILAIGRSRLLALSAGLLLSVLLALPAAANVAPRLVTGWSASTWAEWVGAEQSGLGMSKLPRVSTPNNLLPGGRGVSCPCTITPPSQTPSPGAGTGMGRFFPGIGPFFDPILPRYKLPSTVSTVMTTGGGTATVPIITTSVGLPTPTTQMNRWLTQITIGDQVGESVIIPPAKSRAFTGTATSGFSNQGAIVLLTTIFTGYNTTGTLMASGGPGTLPPGAGAASTAAGTGLWGTNPLTTAWSSVPSVATMMGGTTTWPPLNALPNTKFRVKIQPGKNQFGGALLMVGDAQNQLVFPDIVNGGNLARTNGTYAGQPAGVGETRRTVRKYENTLNPAIRKTAHYQWWGWDWTTGKVSEIFLVGNQGLTSVVRSGTDTLTAMGMRQLSLVGPTIDYTPVDIFSGAEGGSIFMWHWRIQVVPEPDAAAGLVAGIGLLGLAYWRRKAA